MIFFSFFPGNLILSQNIVKFNIQMTVGKQMIEYKNKKRKVFPRELFSNVGCYIFYTKQTLELFLFEQQLLSLYVIRIKKCIIKNDIVNLVTPAETSPLKYNFLPLLDFISDMFSNKTRLGASISIFHISIMFIVGRPA